MSLESNIFSSNFSNYGNLNYVYTWIQNIELIIFQWKFVFRKFFIRIFHLIPVRGFSSDHRKFIKEFNFLVTKSIRFEFSSYPTTSEWNTLLESESNIVIY